MDSDDRFGLFKPLFQASDFLLSLRQFGRLRMRSAGFRSAPGRGQGAEEAGLALAAPVGQGRRVEPLAAQNGTDVARAGGAVGLLQDAQLLPGSKFSRAVNVRRLGRVTNSGLAAAGAGTTVGLRPSSVPAPAAAVVCATLLGMTTRPFSYALKLKHPGGLCLIIIGTEGDPLHWICANG